MTCDEARPLLPFLTRTDEPLAELSAVREHLAGCPACQAALDAERRNDREWSQRLLAVPIPSELHARLSRDFAAVQRPAPQETSGQINRRTWSTAAAIVSLVALCGFLTWWLLRPSPVPLRDVLIALAAQEFSPGWRTASGADRPAGWSQLRGLHADEPRWAPAGPVAAQVVRFTYQRSRFGTPVGGHLWIIDAKAIADAAEIPVLEFAPVRYTPGQPHLVWNERGVIYLLVASGDVAALEQLQLALRKSRSLA